jgi:hypothetical protein
MSNDIKKEKVKKLLESIQIAANQLIDMGTPNDPSDIVMTLAMSAYELDLMHEMTNKFTNTMGVVDDTADVIEFKPKELK